MKIQRKILKIILIAGLFVYGFVNPMISLANNSIDRPNNETTQRNITTTANDLPAASQNFSKPSDTDSSTLKSPDSLPDDYKHGRSFLTDFEYGLTLVILLFGALVLLAEYLLLREAKKSSYELLQLFAVNLIITGTLVLISAGYSAEQIAPAMGLFGTIAGYLLGRRTNQNNHTKDEDDDH